MRRAAVRRGAAPRGVGWAAAAVIVAASVLTAPAAHAAEPDGCALGMFGQWLHLPGCDASTTDPTPNPSATSPTSTPSSGPMPAPPAPGDESTPAPAPTAAPAAEDDAAAPVFTAATPGLSGSALSLEGLRDIRIVQVRRVDGSTARSLRISADRVVVEGFHLDVPAEDGGLANDDERMIAEGDVVVYADSLTGILLSGAEVVVDTLSAPPSPDTLRELTRLHIPLIGMTADRVTHAGSHQQIHG